MRTRNTDVPEHCTIPDCKRPHLAKGLCRMHYKRNWRYGDPNIRHVVANGEAQSFAQDLLDKPPTTDSCITWPFAKAESGHGSINCQDREKVIYVSRWLLTRITPQPSKLHLALHSCGKGHEACVNPKHLYWGTQADNTHDMVVAGRHPTQKINAVVAQAIWDAKGTGTKHEVAERFPPATSDIVSNIWHHNSWANHISK